MTKRHADEVIVERWTVDPTRLRAFTAEMRSRYGDSPFAPKPLLDICEQHAQKGLEVVCRDDAVFVGEWCLAFLYNQVSGIDLQDSWMRFEMEGGLYEIPVPLGVEARAQAARAIEYYVRVGEEERREALAKRQAPTWSNYLLNIAEAHTIWVILGFFFVGIPAVVVVLGLLRGGFD